MDKKIVIALGLMSLLFACNSSDDDGTDDDINKPPPKETDCSIEVLIDATSYEDWVYFDLESQKIVTPANPDDSREWDIAFQRFKVKSNGGINGTGGVEVAQVLATACNDLLEAPATGYLMDAPDGDDDMMLPDYAISFGPSSETGPWAYDPMTHHLSQSGSIFVVKSVEGNYFKLDFFEYYGPTGTDAELTFFYKDVKAPPKMLPPGAIEVPTAMNAFTYIDVDQGVISVDDPASSTEWDLAVSGPAWQTNGGTMRAGIGGARIADGNDFDAITAAPTIGYQSDAEIPYPGPPGSPRYIGNPVLVNWFDYDPVTHLATPKDEVYLIRAGDGSYAKLRILDYDNEKLTYVLKLDPIDRSVEKVQGTIPAGAGGDFTYFNLRLGEVVEIDDPSTSTEWDLGVSGTRIRTNGGTSGPGEGGAAGPIAMPLDAIIEVPSAFTSDAMIADPENPGTDYSGNPVLAGWFETTTSTVPKDVAFVVKTADGGYSKVKITGWVDGTFTIDHAYAGAGQNAF